MSLGLKFAAVSDRGLIRKNNEDAAFAGPFVVALADGMGGHAAGEVASKIMIDRMSKLNRDPEDNDMLALLGASAADANADIAEHVRAHPETEGMGCTLTAMMFNGREFGVVHAGDSRGYRLRDGKLSQVTKDDTFVQSLVDAGKLDPADVSSHPQKSLILKAYTGRDVEPALFMLDAKVGDRLLLCSDGLSDPVTASTIEAALGQGSLSDAATMLVELALRSGGPDNVTVVVAEVVEDVAEAAAVRVGGDDAQEVERPDTAASRAALLNRTPQVIAPSAEVEPKKKRGLLKGVIARIVALLVLVVAGGFGAKAYVNSQYYVAVGSGGEIVIQKGVDFSVLGRPLNHKYQNACLDKSNTVSVRNEDCAKGTVFTLSALPEPERAAVANLPRGSYDQAQKQLGELAAKALPVCLVPGGTKCREVR